MQRWFSSFLGFVALSTCFWITPRAADCTKTSVGLIPLIDLREGEYQGKQGGLYPGGANTRPLAHELAGLEQARRVRALDAAGQPSAAGKIVLLSIGMSNTTQEFSTFKPMADADADKNPQLVIVDGAQGGMTASIISNPNNANYQTYWSTVDTRLRAAGVTAAQVQAAWVKEADAGPNAAFPNDALILKPEFAEIARILMTRFPNIRLAYYSSRIYAGYASSTLNPEPFAYQSGFAVKWLIEDQINGAPDLNFDAARGPVRAPWLSWGPYLWADGLKPRSDGLTYACTDLVDDGTHPSAGGARNKVAQLLLDFLKTDSSSRSWFLNGRSAARSSLVAPTLNAVTGSEWAGAIPMASGLAVTNLSATDSTLTLTAMAPDGRPLQGTGISNPKLVTLPSGGQFAAMSEQIFGAGIRNAAAPAWMLMEGNLERMSSFFLLFRDPSMLGGVPLSGRPISSWIFPEISLGGLMQLHLVNLNSTAATATLQLIRSDGTPRAASAGRALPAGGILSTALSDLFPAVPWAESDYLRVTTSQGVFPAEIFGKLDRHLAALNGQDTSAGAAMLYCPQYVTGSFWQTRLSVVNLDPVSGSVTLEYFSDAGSPQAPPRTLPVAARGKLHVTDPRFFLDPGSDLSQGYLRISGNGLKLTGSVSFGDAQQEVLSAALPLLAQLETAVVVSQVASGQTWYTGIALLNPGEAAADVNLELFDSRGLSQAARTEKLAAHQRRSLLLTQFFPALEGRELSAGYIKITSNRPMGVFAVYGTRDLASLAAIPAQPIS